MPSPSKIRKQTRIASPRGITRASHLTGKERGIASAKPPSNTTGTVGANHMSNTRATSPSTSSTLRVLLETRMGVGRRAPPAARPVRSFLCFTGFHRRISSNKDARDLADRYARASLPGRSRVPSLAPALCLRARPSSSKSSPILFQVSSTNLELSKMS